MGDIAVVVVAATVGANSAAASPPPPAADATADAVRPAKVPLLPAL